MQYRPSQYRRPPNTAAHFQVPNKGFSEYRPFFASPKFGGIEGFDCIEKGLIS